MAHPSVGSSTLSAPETAPSPGLKQAIASLMVNLDDELLRYRQSRTGQTGTQRRAPLFKTKAAARSAPSLIHLKSAAAPRPSEAKAGVTPPPPRPYRSGVAGSANAPSPLPPSLTPAYPPTTGRTLMPYQVGPEDYLESSEALLGSVPPAYLSPDVEDEIYVDEDYRPSLTERLSTPLGLGALLLLLVGSAGFGYLVTSPTAVDHLRNHPWVQRFQPDPEPVVTSSPGTASIPTGIQGIGPDLSEQEFGALDLDRISTLPSNRAPDSMAQSFPPEDDLEAEQDAEGGTENPGTTAVDRPAETARSGPQSVTPVPMVNRPATSPTADSLPRPTVAPPRPAPSPAPTPTATAPSPAPPTAAPAAAAPAPSTPASTPTSTPTAPPAPPSPPSAPAQSSIAPPAANAQPPQPLGRVAIPPTPTAATPPAPLAPAAPAAPAARPSYYVITDYSGSQSLESARRVVGDAYVRNMAGGTKIQMGAFSQESSARSLAEQLQQQGIPARVYTP